MGAMPVAAQFAGQMSYLQAPGAGVSFPFFPDPSAALSLPAQLLAPHSAAWNPFAPRPIPIASPLPPTHLAHTPMGYPTANAFLEQRGMARWVALGVPPPPAVALAPIAPGLGALPTRPSVFRSPVILNGQFM